MKRYTLYIMTGLLALTSCEDVFDTESTSVVMDNGQRIEHPADSLYSAMGILYQDAGADYLFARTCGGFLILAANELLRRGFGNDIALRPLFST